MTNTIYFLTGLPGTGKTSVGFELAKQLNAKNQPTNFIDQDFLEEDRLVARNLIRAISPSNLPAEFKQQAEEIFRDSRPAFFRTLYAMTVSALRLNQNVVMPINFRIKDHKELKFMEGLIDAVSAHIPENVEICCIHLKANAEKSLQRIEARGIVSDELESVAAASRADIIKEAPLYAQHGPFYPEYETLVLDPWAPAEKSAQTLAKELLEKTIKNSGITTVPAPRALKIGKCVDRGLCRDTTEPHPPSNSTPAAALNADKFQR